MCRLCPEKLGAISLQERGLPLSEEARNDGRGGSVHVEEPSQIAPQSNVRPRTIARLSKKMIQ
jgi:hypothetical protein